jgi:hypothetical protein
MATDTSNQFSSSVVTDFRGNPLASEELVANTLGNLSGFEQLKLDALNSDNFLNNMSSIGISNDAVKNLTPELISQGIASGDITPELASDLGIDFQAGLDFGATNVVGGAGNVAQPTFLGKAKQVASDIFMPKIDEKAGVATDAPFVGIATGLGALGNIYLGNKQLDQAEDVFKFNKKLAIANFTQQQNAASTNIFNKARNEALLSGKTQAEANQIGDRAVDKSGVKNVNIG